MIANTLGIGDFDPVVQQALDGELRRQEEHIELIASEKLRESVGTAVHGSVLPNKYAEGYPGKRYYGCEFVDALEQLTDGRNTNRHCSGNYPWFRRRRRPTGGALDRRCDRAERRGSGCAGRQGTRAGTVPALSSLRRGVAQFCRERFHQDPLNGAPGSSE